MAATEAEQPGANNHDAHLGRLASVGQIAAGIAHEVRNPLTAVRGFLQLLKEKNEQKYIDIAETELNNAIGILQNLLQVSKPDLEDEPFESIDMAHELDGVAQLFQDQLYRVRVESDFQSPGTYVYAKRNQIKKALFNLLKNAFEAIPDEGTIRIGQRVTEEAVYIYVEDSGVGIPKEKLGMLGTPFFTTKDSGTGMGLAFVYSVVYQNRGSIQVESKERVGTKFTLSFPRGSKDRLGREAVQLDLKKADETQLKEFFVVNRDAFEERLLQEAVNVRDKIDEIRQVGNINLLDNAHKLVLMIVEGKAHDVAAFGRMEGVAWAKHSLTLAFKLEWIQAVRRVMWDFLYNFDRMKETALELKDFYNLEKRINELMDQFSTQLFMSYTQYKDDLIRSQREMMEDLSVPIIPLNTSTSILPLIGHIDRPRADKIEDIVISRIGNERIETLIMDLSGVVQMESDVVRHLINVIDGIRMMGCSVVITGLRPEIVKTMIRAGLSFETKAVMKGTLQQALADHLPSPGRAG
ncbi:ATP-binding protein [Paenibacillus sp.]|uniref:ATP-binding protein n=1 Tax=Paenibacillus sp. TaxID=58172 RepID=UPI002D4A41A4|nr:ATP-binding protein [Paenibacillus sp.]HZG55345.1 ATP-binding protein [Paenibacillus sp.]